MRVSHEAINYCRTESKDRNSLEKASSFQIGAMAELVEHQPLTIVTPGSNPGSSWLVVFACVCLAAPLN